MAHDAAYSEGKDLDKRTISDKILKDRAYEMQEFVDMMDVNGHSQGWSINFLIRKKDWERV